MARSIDKGHGRTEKRTLQTTSILTSHDKWEGLKQGFIVTRERTINGQKTVESVCGITSLPRVDARTLLDLVRNHWKIENQLHYIRDVTLKEDLCRVRKGQAPQVLAALRNAVVHLLNHVDAKSSPEAIELLQIHTEFAHELIGIPKCE